MRADQEVLFPSKTSPPTVNKSVANSEWESGSSAENITAAGGLRRISVAKMKHSLKELLVSTPAYPSGVGGCLFSSRPPGICSPRETNICWDYRLVLDKGASYSVTGEAASRFEMPWGLEAARDEASGVLTVRELLPSSNLEYKSGRDGRNSGEDFICGNVVAHIEASVKITDEREAAYSVVLRGYESEGEVMAVRVTTQQTRLKLPRKTRALLLLAPQGTERDAGWIPVWESSRALNDSEGLWEAVAHGRINKVVAVELRNKRPVWSPTTAAFELDLLEAWRPGWIGTGLRQKQSQSLSQPAPETVQMVAVSRRDGGNRSARSDSNSPSSSSSTVNTGRDNRLPVMQLVRMNLNRPGSEIDGPADGSPGSFDSIADGCEFHWRLALAAPVSVLHGFCLSVIGLETGTTGASVSLVDRAIAAAAVLPEAAESFLGFEKALVSKQGDDSPLPGGAGDTDTAVPRLGLRPSMIEPALSARSSRGGAPSNAPLSNCDPYITGDIGESAGSDGDGVAPSVLLPAPVLGAMEAGPRRGGPSALVPKQGDGSPTPGGTGDTDTAVPRLGLRPSMIEPALSARSSRGDAPSNAPLSNCDPYITGDIGESAGSDGDGVAPPVLLPALAVGTMEAGPRRGGPSKPPASDLGIQEETKAAAGSSRGAAGPATCRTVAIPVKRRMSLKKAAVKIVDKVYRNTYVGNICLATLMVSFVADLYPGSPSHNAPLSAALLWASCNVDTVRALRRRSLAYTLSVAVLVSLVMDLDFLVSPTKAYALAQLEEEDDDQQGAVVAQHMHAFGRITVTLVATLKALSWQGLLATSPQGIHALSLFWRRFKLFLPIWGSPRKLTNEVYNRIIALAWLHILGAVVLTSAASVAALGLGWAPQLASAQGAGAPLFAVCFLKSVTDLLTSAALFRNIDLALCCNVFGCLACFQGWHRAREERRRTRHGVTYPKVILEWDYIMLCVYVKVFDLVVGLWLWIGLGWSWSGDLDYSGRYTIRMLLLVVTIVQTLTDIWSVFLGITVTLLVSQYLLRKEKMAGAARQAFGEGSDGDVEIVRGVGTGRLLSPPSLSPDVASLPGGIPNAGVQGRNAHGDKGKGQSETEGMETGSEDDSYSSGESDTEEDKYEDTREGSFSRQIAERRETASGDDINLYTPPAGSAQTVVAGVVAVGSEPASGEPTLNAPSAPVPVLRRRSTFAPGGNRFVYKQVFSARSSSDDSGVAGVGDGASTMPETIALDRGFSTTSEEFSAAWDSLSTCANFRCRIGRFPEIEAVAAHFFEQGFFVVACGDVSEKTKIYACARGVGLEAIFYAELVFEKEMHELEFTFKCTDERLKAQFACHMHLRRIIGDHQPIA